VDFAATSTRWPDPLAAVVCDCDGGAGVDVEFSAPSVNVVSEAGTEAIPGVGGAVRVGVDVAAPPAGGTVCPAGGPVAEVEVPGSLGLPDPDGVCVEVAVGDSRPGGDPLGCTTPPPTGGGPEVADDRAGSDVTGACVGCGPWDFVPSGPLGEAVGEPWWCLGCAWCVGVPSSLGLEDLSSLGEQLGELCLPCAWCWLGSSVLPCASCLLCGHGHGACEEGVLHDSCPPRSAPAPDPGSRAANAMPAPRQTAATSVPRRRSPRVTCVDSLA
jgi:hypothetical protein